MIKPIILIPAALAISFATALVPAQAKNFQPATGTIVDARWASGLPLGGLGVGKIELLTDGSFANFTNQNNWDRPYPWAAGAFAAVRARAGTGAPIAKLLRLSSAQEYKSLANVQHTRMQGWFPRAQIVYVDRDLPIQVQLQAFSPLIPHDIKDSSLPVACLCYTLTNPTAQPVEASIMLAWPNLLGSGGSQKGPFGGKDQLWSDLKGDTQTPATAGALHGLHYTTTQTYPGQERQNVLGDDFVGVRPNPGLAISTCPSWDAAAPTPAFWETFKSTGDLQPAVGPTPAQPAGAVAAKMTLAPGQSRTVRFYVVWAMPHLVTARPQTAFGPNSRASRAGIAGMFSRKPGARWHTGRAMQAGDNIVLDLGKTCTPTHLTLGSGTAATDYPRGLRVEVSPDGKKWQPVADLPAPAMQANGEIALTPTPGRYLRLTNETADSYYYWSIYSLTVHIQEQPQPLALTASSATAHLMVFHYLKDAQEDVSHFWCNWWQTAPDIAAYVDENSDRLLAGTLAWQTPVMNSDLPFWLKLKLINCAFPVVTNSVLTRDGRFTQLESPIMMFGSLGTMDQRMAAHAFYTAFFPELDRVELELYATCQQPDGRITHFDGNVHEVIGRPDVFYGITDWPDLSCSWVMQVVKLYRWTGDKAFLDRMQPHITRAMSWLNAAGQNDDHIPTGGSTYDYQTLPPGAFIYTASCYLGALRAAAAAAPDPDQAAIYNQRLAEAQQSVMRNLWNGSFFRKWKQPSTGKAVENSFVANLAGDWLARLAGLPRTLDPDIIHRAIAQTIARHLKPFHPVPPMEVTPEGKLATHSCYLSQDEPFLGCEAIYENFTNDGLDTIRRVYLCAWEVTSSPWNQGLAYNAPGGQGPGGTYYMTCPTSWFVLDALGGTSVDIPGGRLFISPRLWSGQKELHIPVYFSRFWAWLDYAPADHHLTLRIDRVFPPAPGSPAPESPTLETMLFHAPAAATSSSRSEIRDPKSEIPPPPLTLTSIAADGDATPIPLPHPFVVQPGSTLDLSPFMNQLNLPSASESVDVHTKPVVHS